ncbi:MAG: hypothetical protein VKK04_14030 [Synechococcales bacterium]|nr:hypothetical protein [Synechococcales bacterium]
MVVRQFQYEELLAEYSDHQSMIGLLRQFRPYLEMLPSMRRPDESLITLPLPLVRLRSNAPAMGTHFPSLLAGDLVQLPCEIAVLMCDPEWKIKTGVEICVFIHRPHEDFSGLLGRWRQTQIWLDKGYDWIMPPRHKHIFGEGAEETYSLFVIFPETPERIKRGLIGASLPFVVQSVNPLEAMDDLDAYGFGMDDLYTWGEYESPNTGD